MLGSDGRRNTTTSPCFGSPIFKIFVFSTGSRSPYANLFTKMKSPLKSVGIIDSEGIRKGSNKNERITSTSRRIGKNDFAYSTMTGSAGGGDSIAAAAASIRARLSSSTSRSQTTPAVAVSSTSISAKSNVAPRRGPLTAAEYSSFLIDLQHGQERFLRYFDGAELLHSLLARLLLLEELALARDVAAVELRGDVLAIRLHGAACDDLTADRSLNRDFELLTRNDFLQCLDHPAAFALDAVAMRDQGHRVDLLLVDQDVELHERTGLEA